MKFFFDTEFVDDGQRIHLISIGIAAEDGRTYYAELLPASALYAIGASDWVMLNVAQYLEGRAMLKARDRVAREIIDFVGERPEFWADTADYDWVALSQLYGSLMQRPKGWPMTALDIVQLPNFSETEVHPINAHNALSDAIALRDSFVAYHQKKR
jgi:hypothetical protein